MARRLEGRDGVDAAALKGTARHVCLDKHRGWFCKPSEIELGT
jgi:hypothetical protein